MAYLYVCGGAIDAWGVGDGQVTMWEAGDDPYVKNMKSEKHKASPDMVNMVFDTIATAASRKSN